MKELNSLIVYFILFIYIIHCTYTFGTKSETDLQNLSNTKLCGVYEGKIKLIVYDTQKKIVSNSLTVNINSENFSFYNKEKKTLIKNFKMEELLKLNKIPLIRHLPQEANSSCFELIFNNDDKSSNIKIIPLTLCANGIDDKISYLKEIINKKQCQLNRKFRELNGLDRSKVIENFQIINKLVDDRNKKLKKGLLDKNGKCCLNDNQQKQKFDEDDEALKKIKIDLRKAKQDKKSKYPKFGNYTGKEDGKRKKKISGKMIKKEFLLKKLLEMKEAINNQMKKDIISKKDKKDEEERLRKLAEYMKKMQKLSLNDLLNNYKNLIKNEKEKELKKNLNLLNFLNSIEKMKKGNTKVCLINSGQSGLNYKNQMKNVCISIHGMENTEKVKTCMKSSNNFCNKCCEKYAMDNPIKIKDCKKSCENSIKNSALQSLLDNSINKPSKIKYTEKGKKDKKENLLDNLLGAYKNKIKNKKRNSDLERKIDEKKKKKSNDYNQNPNNIDKLKKKDKSSEINKDKGLNKDKQDISDKLKDYEKDRNKNKNLSELERLMREIERKRKEKLEKEKLKKFLAEKDKKNKIKSKSILDQLLLKYKDSKKDKTLLKDKYSKYNQFLNSNKTNQKYLGKLKSKIDDKNLIDNLLLKYKNNTLINSKNKKSELLKKNDNSLSQGKSDKKLDYNLKRIQKTDKKLKQFLPDLYKIKTDKDLSGDKPKKKRLNENDKLIDVLLGNFFNTKNKSRINKTISQSDKDTKRLSLDELLLKNKNNTLSDYLKNKKSKNRKRKNYLLENLLNIPKGLSLKDKLKSKFNKKLKKNITKTKPKRQSLEKLLYGSDYDSLKNKKDQFGKNVIYEKKKKGKKYNLTQKNTDKLSTLLPLYKADKYYNKNKSLNYNKINDTLKNSILDNINKLRSNNYLENLKKLMNQSLIDSISDSLKKKYNVSKTPNKTLMDESKRKKEMNEKDLFGNINDLANKLNQYTKNLNDESMSRNKTDKYSNKSIDENCIDVLVNDESEDVIDFSKMKNFGNCSDVKNPKKINGPQEKSSDAIANDFNKKDFSLKDYDNKSFEFGQPGKKCKDIVLNKKNSKYKDQLKINKIGTKIVFDVKHKNQFNNKDLIKNNSDFNGINYGKNKNNKKLNFVNVLKFFNQLKNLKSSNSGKIMKIINKNKIEIMKNKILEAYIAEKKKNTKLINQYRNILKHLHKLSSDGNTKSNSLKGNLNLKIFHRLNTGKNSNIFKNSTEYPLKNIVNKNHLKAPTHKSFDLFIKSNNLTTIADLTHDSSKRNNGKMKQKEYYQSINQFLKKNKKIEFNNRDCKDKVINKKMLKNKLNKRNNKNIRISNSNSKSRNNIEKFNKTCNFSSIFNSISPINGPESNNFDYVYQSNNSIPIEKCDSDINFPIGKILPLDSRVCKDKLKTIRKNKFNLSSSKIFIKKTLKPISEINIKDLSFANITNLLQIFKVDKTELINLLSKLNKLIKIKNLLEESCDKRAYEISNIFYKGLIYKLKSYKAKNKRLEDFSLVEYNFENLNDNLNSAFCKNGTFLNVIMKKEIEKGLEQINELIHQNPDCLNYESIKFNSTIGNCEEIKKAKKLYDKLLYDKTRFSILIKMVMKIKKLRNLLNKQLKNLDKKSKYQKLKKYISNKNDKSDKFSYKNTTIKSLKINNLNKIKSGKKALKIKIKNEMKILMKLLKKRPKVDYKLTHKLKNLKGAAILNTKNITLKNKNPKISKKLADMKRSFNRTRKQNNIFTKYLNEKCDDFVISHRLKKLCFNEKGIFSFKKKNKETCKNLKKFLLAFEIKKLQKGEMKDVELSENKKIEKAIKLKSNCDKKALLVLQSRIDDLKRKCSKEKNKSEKLNYCFEKLEIFSKIFEMKRKKCKVYRNIMKQFKKKADRSYENSLENYSNSSLKTVNISINNEISKIFDKNCTLNNQTRSISGPSYDWEDFIVDKILAGKNSQENFYPKNNYYHCNDIINKIKLKNEMNNFTRKIYKNITENKTNCSDENESFDKTSGPETFHSDIIFPKSLVRKINKFKKQCNNIENNRIFQMNFMKEKLEKSKKILFVNGPKETSVDIIIQNTMRKKDNLKKIKQQKICDKLKEFIEDEIEIIKNVKSIPDKCHDIIERPNKNSYLKKKDLTTKNELKKISVIKLEKEQEKEKEKENKIREYKNNRLRNKLKILIGNYYDKLPFLKKQCSNLEKKFQFLEKKDIKNLSRIINGPKDTDDDIILDKNSIFLAQKCLKNKLLNKSFVNKILTNIK